MLCVVWLFFDEEWKLNTHKLMKKYYNITPII